MPLKPFDATTQVLSMINVNTRGVTIPNIVVGLAFGYGGLVQLLAGMWEFAAGNTFGATAFSSYGGFWISYACIQVPFFGITGPNSAYAEAEPMLANALGIYLFSWMIVGFV
jgi:succinate-acetate transporter protein